MMNLVMAAAFFLVCLANLFVLRRTGWMCPHNLFIYFNGVMGLGILVQLDFARDDDRVHAVVVFLSAIIYLLFTGAFAISLRLRRAWSSYRSSTTITCSPLDFQISLAGYFIGFAAAVIYFYLVGYNVLAVMLSSGSSGADITSMRLASYSGRNYYAPGYFNQFKNILLPWCFLTLVVVLKEVVASKIIFRILVLALLMPVIFSLLGTGQRTFFVFFVIEAFIFRVLLSRGKLSFSRFDAACIAIGFLVLFSYMSVALGRTAGASLVGGLDGFVSRAFFEQQIGSINGFRYIFHMPVQYGSDWATDLMSIFPGNHGTRLANKVAAMVYGDDRGTVPISLWTSVYLNWGWIGVCVFPAVIAFIYSRLSRRIMSLQTVSVFQLVGYALLSFTCATWIASGPMQLLNNGLATILLLLGLFRFLTKSKFRRLYMK